MVTFPPYIREIDAYWKLPEEHRWIFNKLEICKRFGYESYGPCGARMPIGTYCIRPIINLGGMANGGFSKHEVFEHETLGVCNDSVDKPGYCWTPWTDEFRAWYEYVDDECWYAQKMVKYDEGTQLEYAEPDTEKMELPEQLKGISRYMVVETLGDTIIDIGPRHTFEDAHHEIVDDYRQFDPNWEVPPSVEFGFKPTMRRFYDSRIDAYRLEEVEQEHIPWEKIYG